MLEVELRKEYLEPVHSDKNMNMSLGLLPSFSYQGELVRSVPGEPLGEFGVSCV